MGAVPSWSEGGCLLSSFPPVFGGVGSGGGCRWGRGGMGGVVSTQRVPPSTKKCTQGP